MTPIYRNFSLHLVDGRTIYLQRGAWGGELAPDLDAIFRSFGLVPLLNSAKEKSVTQAAPKPKRHHFIPQMMLRHFADDDSRLWFWRRAFPKGEARRTVTANLFVEKDLYTYTLSDGAKDLRLEDFFAQLEGEGGKFINAVADIVRAGKTPELAPPAWSFWDHFFFYHHKRTPGAMAAYSEAMDFGAKLDEAVEEAKAEAAAAGRKTVAADLDAQVRNNARVVAQSISPSPELLALFETTGLAIYRIVDSRKSFVVGDVPGATARFRMRDGKISRPTLFLPLTWDIAVGQLEGGRRVEIVPVDRDQIRLMNIATTERATTIAGRSESLVNSLSSDVIYTGVPIDEAFGGSGEVALITDPD